MDIPGALPYIQFLGQMALITGAIFAGYQFMESRKERRDQASIQVLTQLQNDAFHQAYARMWKLPIEASAEEVRAGGKEMTDAVRTVMMTFESLGVMVHNRIVPIDTVDQVIGGFLRESWRRCHKYIEADREELHAPRLGEWYQWLAEHLGVEERRSRGAYETFRDWRP